MSKLPSFRFFFYDTTFDLIDDSSHFGIAAFGSSEIGAVPRIEGRLRARRYLPRSDVSRSTDTGNRYTATYFDASSRSPDSPSNGHAPSRRRAFSRGDFFLPRAPGAVSRPVFGKQGLLSGHPDSSVGDGTGPTISCSKTDIYRYGIFSIYVFRNGIWTFESAGSHHGVPNHREGAIAAVISGGTGRGKSYFDGIRTNRHDRRPGRRDRHR